MLAANTYVTLLMSGGSGHICVQVIAPTTPAATQHSKRLQGVDTAAWSACCIALASIFEPRHNLLLLHCKKPRHLCKVEGAAAVHQLEVRPVHVGPIGVPITCLLKYAALVCNEHSRACCRLFPTPTTGARRKIGFVLRAPIQKLEQAKCFYSRQDYHTISRPQSKLAKAFSCDCDVSGLL